MHLYLLHLVPFICKLTFMRTYIYHQNAFYCNMQWSHTIPLKDSEKSISVDVPIHDRVNCVGRSSCFLFPLKRSYNRLHNSPECLLQNNYKRKISSYKHLDSEQNPSTIKYPSPDYHFPSKIGTAFHLLNWTGFL